MKPKPRRLLPTAEDLFDDWFDPIEAAVREQVRGFISSRR
jgi:hypothetical protein